ncbi:kinase-like domain-containing protein [Flammula alnicola]|nr:kinase-like domain-containing protein [Flammula alnicola]
MASTPKSRQLLARGDIFDDNGGFIHIALVWTENSQIYFTNLASRQFDDNALDEVDGKLIPKEAVYASWRESIREAKTPLPPDTYTKMPYWHCFEGKANFKLINAEIDVLEILSTKPHPNIVEYHGCIRDGDCIAGICLRKYLCTLEEFIEGQVPAHQCPPFDADSVVSGIKAGLDFLHGLGLVHDDINPRNIMLNAVGHAIIIDFDSCAPIGAKSRGGTPGWSKNPTIAQVENDEHGLDLLVKFIQGQYDGQDLDAFGM